MPEKPTTFDEIIQQGDLFGTWIASGQSFIEVVEAITKEGQKLRETYTRTAEEMKTALTGLNPAAKEDQKQIAEYSARIEELEKAMKKLQDSQEKLNKARKDATEESIRANKINRERIQEVRDDIKVEGTATNSIERKVQKLKELTQLYRRVDEETRKRMIPGMKKLTEEISKASQVVGKHQLEVGKYGKIWDGAKGIIAKATGIIAGAYGAIKLGGMIIQSTDASSDAWARTTNRLSNAWALFAKSFATWDWNNFLGRLDEAVRGGAEFADQLDKIQDRRRAYSVQEAKARKEIAQLKIDQANQLKSTTEQIAAGEKIKQKEEELAKMRSGIGLQAVNALTDKLKDLTGLTKEQSIALVENFDSQEKMLEVGKRQAKWQDDITRGNKYVVYTKEQITQLQAEKDAYGALIPQVIAFAAASDKLSGTERDQLAAALVELYGAEAQALENTRRVESALNADKAKNNKEEIKGETDAAKERKKIIKDVTDWELTAEDDLKFALKWSNEVYQESIKDNNKDRIKNEEELNKELLDRDKAYWDEKDKKRDEDKAKAEKSEEDKQRAILEIIDASAQIATAIMDYKAASLESEYEEELKAAGDNEAAKEAVEKKFAERRQKLAIGQAYIDGAAAVLKASINAWPLPAIPLMALAGTLTEIQIATIKKQKFAEGGSGLLDFAGGVLPGKSHAEGGVNLGAIGEAERGEYFGIVNKQMTSKYSSLLPSIFESLNSGSFENIWGKTMQQIQPVVIKDNNESILKSINSNLIKFAKNNMVLLEDGRVMIEKDGNIQILRVH